MLAAVVALALVCAAACDRGPPPVVSPPRAGPFAVGVPVFEANHWIEYAPGDAPLIIIAPLGGSIEPRNLRRRKCEGYLSGIDYNTQAIVRAVVDSFVAHTGHRPHLVVNLLHRGKFDANRGRTVATGEHVELESTWYWLHAAIDSAKASVIRQSGRGRVIDLHGQDHSINRIEVGYLLSTGALRRISAGSAAVATPVASCISSIARASASGDSHAAMHNGPNSLGGMLAAGGWRESLQWCSRDFLSGSTGGGGLGFGEPGALELLNRWHSTPGHTADSLYGGEWNTRLLKSLALRLTEYLANSSPRLDHAHNHVEQR